MSGQFWKLSVDSKDFITLVSTIRGMKTKFTFSDFTNAIVRGIIQPC